MWGIELTEIKNLLQNLRTFYFINRFQFRTYAKVTFTTYASIISLLKEVYTKDPKTGQYPAELRGLLTQQNKKGFNALHHIASAKNPVILCEFVNFAKEQLGEVDAMLILFNMASQGDIYPKCNPSKDNVFTDDMKNANRGLAALAGLKANKEPDRYGKITYKYQQREQSWSAFFNNASNYTDFDSFKLNPSKIQGNEVQKYFRNFNKVFDPQTSISPTSASATYQRSFPRSSTTVR